MKTFILIYALAAGSYHGGISTGHVEFNSREKCALAAQKFMFTVNPICVEK